MQDSKWILKTKSVEQLGTLTTADTIQLAASQYYTTKMITYYGKDAFRSIELLSDSHYTDIFIHQIQVELKQAYTTKLIGNWRGAEIATVLKKPEIIQASNQEFVYIKTKSNQGIQFKDHLLLIKEQYLSSAIRLIILKLLFSILLSVFIVAAIQFLFRKNEWKNETSLKNLQPLVYMFAVLLFIMFGNSILQVIPDKESHENRNMAELEQISYDNFFNYPNLVDQYTSDQFSFRNILFSLHSFLKFKLFQSSALPQEVIVGKHNWLFKNDPFAVADMRRLNKFEDAALEEMAAILKERIAWLKARNIKYYIMVAPNPERIYREFYPNKYSVVENAGHDRLDFYKKYIHDKCAIDLIDPTDSFMKYKSLQDIFYTNDTHWNSFGAWVAYWHLMNKIKVDFPCLQPIDYASLTQNISYTKKGDLAAMLGLESIYTRKEIELQPKDTNYQFRMSTKSDIIMPYVNEQQIDFCHLKAMIFRDSYANYLLPYFNMHFKNCTYIWSYHFMHEMIEAEKPDLVILEVQQKSMFYAFHSPNLFH